MRWQGAAAFLFPSSPALRSPCAVSAMACSSSDGVSRRQALWQVSVFPSFADVCGIVAHVQYLIQGGVAALGAPLLFGRSASAEAGAAGAFSDVAQGVSFMVPAGWKQQEATFPGGEGNPASPKIVAFTR